MTTMSPTPADRAARTGRSGAARPAASRTVRSLPVHGLGTAIQVLLAVDVALLLAMLKPAFWYSDLVATLPAGTTSVTITFTDPDGAQTAGFLGLVATAAVTLAAMICAVVWSVKVAANIRLERSQRPPAPRRPRPLALVWAAGLLPSLVLWAVYSTAADLPSVAWVFQAVPFAMIVLAAVTAVVVRRVSNDQSARIAAQWRR